LSKGVVHDIPRKTHEHTIQFSNAELEWIKKNPRIVFHTDNNSPPYQYQSLSGSIQGITVDLLKVLQKHTGIEFVIECHTQKEYVNLANMGDAQIFGMWPRFASNAVEDFSPSVTIINGYLSLFAESRAKVQSLLDVTKSRVVTISGTNNRLPDEFSTRNTIVEVNSTQEAISYVLSGKADYMLEFSEVAKYHLQKNQVSTINEVYTHSVPDEGVFMIHKDSPQLLSIVNKCISELEQSDVAMVMKKWHSTRKNHSLINLSREEQEWLKQNPVIRIGSDGLWPPIEWINQAGDFNGLAIDYMKEVEKITGVTFQLEIENDWWGAILPAAGKKRVDGFLALTRTPERDKLLTFTKPYISFPLKLFTRSSSPYIGDLSELHGKRVAVGENYVGEYFLKRDHPGIILVNVKEANDGLKAVRQNRADAFLGNFFTTSYLITRHSYRDLKVSGDTPYSDSLSIALRNGLKDAIPIIQKALDAIPEHRKQQIYSRWVPITIQPPADYTHLWKILIPVLLLLVLVIVLNKQLKAKVKRQVEKVLDIEKQKHLAIKELAVSREKYQNLIETTDDLITSVDRDGKFIYCNHKAEQIYGLSAGECVGRLAFDFIHPDDREETIAWFLTMLETHQVQGNIENRQVSITGEVKDLSWNCRFQYEDGLFKHVDAIARDITDRKRVERKLEREQIFVSTVLDNVPGLLYVYSSSGKLVKWNKAFEKITGYTFDELNNRYLEDWFIDDQMNLDKVRSTVKKVHDIGYGEVEAELQIKGGEKVPFHFNGTLVDMEGESYLIGVGTDLRERRESEAEIRKGRRQLRTIIDTMPSALIGINGEQAVVLWNTKAHQSTGVSPEDAMGKQLCSLMPYFNDDIGRIRQAIDNNETVSWSRKLTAGNTATTFNDIVVYPMMQDDTISAVVRIDDVTERAKLEEVMIQTEKMQSVGGLAAGMAHEINNPLASITQGIQNILRRLDPTLDRNKDAAMKFDIDLENLHAFLDERKILQFLHGGKDAVERAAGIVKNMLMFSRQSTSEKKLTDIKQLVEHTIELGSTDYDMKKRYDFKFIEITREYSPKLPMITLCPNEIEQVLLNLFKNALQAMETIEREGYKPHFYLRLIHEAGFIRIEVEDNGPGIPEKLTSRIFEPFYTTKAVGEGTGLGLSVSYMLVTQNHGGTFSVESEQGKYTKFIIRLPL